MISSLSNKELAQVLDAVYRNLDTPVPELGAVFWYETCLEVSLRRHGSEPQIGVNFSGPALGGVSQTLRRFSRPSCIETAAEDAPAVELTGAELDSN